MRILFLADGRSPTTIRYLAAVRELGHEIHLVSSYPCEEPADLAGFEILPVAFSNFVPGRKSNANAAASSAEEERKEESDAEARTSRTGVDGLRGALVRRFRNTFLSFRYQLAPISVPLSGQRFAAIARNVQPDLIHALRIPYEGMVASYAPARYPVAASIWGNDLTFHARGSAGMAALTRRTLERINGLAADTRRDLRLAREFGFAAVKPNAVLPGNGGIDIPRLILASEEETPILRRLPPNRDILINPRGFRPGSVRNDTFFRAIPAVVRQFPSALFVCPAMANQPEAQDWVRTLKIERNVMLLPSLPQADLWSLFRRARMTISVSQHDGTPNSLLEAMTIGCFPIAGDIESLREWITPGVNGLLVDPDSPDELSNAILSAMYNETMREKAAVLNREIIRERVEASSVQTRIEVFYQSIVG